MRPRYLNIAVICLCLVAGVNSSCYSQNFQFRHYSTDEGFTGASFKTLAQDSLGFLWIASASGLYKFDGYNFISYRPILNDSLSLPQEIVGKVWVNPSGKVWVGFPDRISFYDRDLDGFRSYKVSLGGTEPETMWFEDDNVLWLGTAGKGLVRFDLSKRKTIIFLNRNGDSLEFAAQNTIHEIKDEGKSFLLGTANGLWKFDKEKKIFERPLCSPVDSALLYRADVRKIFQHNDHSWIWLHKQLILVNKEFSVLRMLDFNTIKQQFDITKRYEGARVLAIEQDENEVFWIASQGLGLVRFDPDNNELTNFRNDINNVTSLPSDILNHVMIDRDGNIWVATIPKGIAMIKNQSLRFCNYLAGISTGRIIIYHAQSFDHLVVTSPGNGLWTAIMDPHRIDSLAFRKFEPLIENKGFENLTGVYKSHDNLWVSSLQAGIMGLPINQENGLIERGPVKLLQYDVNNPNTISSNSIIGTMAEDEDGNLLAGTRSEGLNKISLSIKYGEEGSVIHYRHKESDSTSISDNGVIDCKPQRDNSIFIATQAGLDILRDNKFDHILKNIACVRITIATDGTLLAGTKIGLYEGRKKGNRYSFTKAPLPGNPFITSIQEDRLGRIWCLSYEGLIYYDRKDKTVLTFKKEDGLPSSRSISGSGSVQTPEGIMIFSNAEGLTIFNPLSLTISKSQPWPVITQLKINNEVPSSGENDSVRYSLPESILTLQHLELDHTQNIIEFEFSAMEMTAPEKNKYQYMLEGFNEHWISTDWKNRKATYTNLHPGPYTFKVMASNRDGVWSNHVKTLAITVLPPPWATWWAYSLYASMVIGILFWARRSILKEERLKSSLRIEHVEREKDQLALSKAQEVDRLKSTFFANISHEFRTPLTLIQGPVQILLEKFTSDSKVKYQLQLIQNNATVLLRLINQLLELARLESGNLKIENSGIELNTFLKLMVEYFESQAKQKQMKLEVEMPEVPYRVLADKDKIETILINLIGNALKFTPANGRVVIKASLDQAEESNASLSIVVQDFGIGIPVDKQEMIFERFYQVNESHNEIGTGIGLALVKELVQLLQGSIAVSSKPGEGSEFMLNIPVVVLGVDLNPQAPEAGNFSEATMEDDGNGNGSAPSERAHKILIVEDNTDLRKFIINSFDDDYYFVEASTGVEGFEIAVHEIPELIISDIMMPEMDGIAMSHKIKKDFRSCHIPILFLTAKATDQSKVEGLETGAEDYLTKPFMRDELILKVKNIISSRTRIREKLRLEILNEAPQIVAESADEKFIMKVKEIIQERLNDPQLSVDTLAQAIGLSRTQLYRKISALTGVSVNELIRSFRLQKAAQLLKRGWGTVSEVAYETGFSNLSYFTRCFKEEFGVLPSRFLGTK